MIGFRLRTFLTLCSLVVVSSIFGRWRQELVDHSMNYRSVVAFGTARKIVDPAQKSKSLGVISEHLIAGRWMEVRAPTMKELNATTVLEFSIEEPSSKIRSGPPLDDEPDYELPVWAGVLPLEMKPKPPIPDNRLIDGVVLPDYVRQYDARLNGKGGPRSNCS